MKTNTRILKNCGRSVSRLCSRSLTSESSELKTEYDAIVVGGGHNGLTAAAYLAKSGKKVCVLERRHVLGGAAVTEEIVPGFKFSRASYLLSLFRPQVMEDLKLKDHGLRYHIRNPSSFTPIRNSDKSLLIGHLDMKKNQEEIGKFSKKDAEAYPRYEQRMEEIVKSIEGLIDQEPFHLNADASKLEALKKLYAYYKLLKPVNMDNIKELYELLTTPISRVLDRWFESDVLKATLATDGVIGFSAGPHSLGTGYVLLHHVMGGLDGKAGVWGIVYGGMGSVSEAIAKAARGFRAELYTEKSVKEILIENGVAKGVKLENGKEIYAKTVLSNLSPKVTFMDLMDKSSLSSDFLSRVKTVEYTSPVTKINVALKELPNFTSRPNVGNTPMPHHQTTIHINCENMQVIDDAFKDYERGEFSKHPAIELTLPSSVDRSIVPNDDHSHVGLIFSQYTPYKLKNGEWDQETKDKYAKLVFSEIDAYAPNFSKSVVGYEVLTPVDLENTFNLTGGNIFHGVMSLDQLYWLRPMNNVANYKTPIKGLYLCGSSTHPGGGVTGGPGRLGAMKALEDMK